MRGDKTVAGAGILNIPYFLITPDFLLSLHISVNGALRWILGLCDTYCTVGYIQDVSHTCQADKAS